jgi:formylglycine-generating enzyme required for sulfatase activity
MGYRKGEEAVLPEREQRHEVQITKPFFMGKFEVTQEEYAKVMDKNPSHFSQDGPGKDKVIGLDTKRFPVERVSWNDAKAFCRILTQDERRAGRITDKMEYTLPTEAEWEYCCRAGTVTNYYFGETIEPAQACFQDTGKGGKRDRPVEVGSFPPNAWGLHDMHGNVWEWCEDWYDAHFYAKSAKQDPFCNVGEQRNYRGGCFHDLAGPGSTYGKSAHRGASGPHWAWYSLGFRVVLRIQ